MPGASEANRTYDGDGKLLTNYGWFKTRQIFLLSEIRWNSFPRLA